MNIRKPEITISAEEIRRRRDEASSTIKSDSYEILAEYYEMVDPKLLDSGVAYRPAKSVEMGKVDQPMINHLRNGVWAIVELNEVMHKLGLQSLDDLVLKEIIALFVAHELHKLNDKNWKDQFDISQEEASKWAKTFGLFDFAPGLSVHDYQSVAAGQHRTIGFHSNLSPKFTLYKPWTDIADTLASIEVPCATDSMQKQLDQIDEVLDFYYHAFNESTGILSNLVHTGIASWAEEKGLYPLLIFERGIVYVGKEGTECRLKSANDIEDIYDKFRYKLNNAHPAITDPKELHKNKDPQGPKGLYKFQNVDFFYSGLENVVKAFVAAAVLDEDSNRRRKLSIDLKNNKFIVDGDEPNMKYPPADVIDIPKKYISSVEVDGVDVDVGDVIIQCTNEERKKDKYTLIPQIAIINGVKYENSKIEIKGTGLMTSQVGYRHHIKDDFDIDIGWDPKIISYSRAISGIRMQLIDPLIKLNVLDTDDAVLETCKMFGVDDEMSQKLSNYAKNTNYDHHKKGGFWNYSYVIACDLFDREVSKKIDLFNYMSNMTSKYMSDISATDLNGLEEQYLYPYKEKMLVWISENLDFNGSMLYATFENKSSKFDCYLDGTGICKLTNDTAYDQNATNPPSKNRSMLKYTFSNRLPIGIKQKPKLEVSIPVEVELGLRRMGHKIKGGDNKIYYRLIPDHFYTPFLSEIFSDNLSIFNENTYTNVKNIVQEFIKSNELLLGTSPHYHQIAKELATDNFSEFSQRTLRYAGSGFRSLFSTYDIVFNKPREKDTEYWFMAAYLGMILAAATGCRVVVSENPISTTKGNEFKEIVKFESPYATVKRIFGDSVSLSKLGNSILLASLIINMAYEYKPKPISKSNKNFDPDKQITKNLQKIRGRLFPGSSILKEIQRDYKKDGKESAFINKARGYSQNEGQRIYDDHISLIEQAIRLDELGGDVVAVNSIHELAELGLKVAIPKGYEPHRVERLFRESVKAITAKKHGDFKKEDYIDAVAGRILKMMRRTGNDQFYYVSGLYDRSRTLEFAESFVDLAFYKISDGQPGKLKQKSNDLSDGFYAATLYQRDDAFKAAKIEFEAAKSGREMEAR